MSVNSGLIAIWSLDQRKVFYRQTIPMFSYVTKETVDIDILVMSRNDDRKFVQSMRIMSRHLENKEGETVQTVQINI